MLILKSFFRKKTTKIYLIIYTFIILILMLLVFTKNVLIQKENELHNGTFIAIKNFDISKYNNKENLNKVLKTTIIQNKVGEEYLLIINNDLKDNEVIISSLLKEKFKNNREFEINNNNQTIKFIIKDFDDNIKYLFLIKVSVETYNKYYDFSNERTIITFKNWLNIQDDVNNLRKIYGDENVFPYYLIGNTNYKNFVTVINILLIVLIFLFIIVLIIANFNIIQDENKKNLLYYKIGYNKYILKLFNILKIIILLIGSTLLGSIIFYIFYIITCFFN